MQRLQQRVRWRRACATSCWNESWEFDRVPGRAFSEVLEAATTTLRDRGEAGRVSARLTTQVVALVGGHTGDGAQGGWRLGVSDPGWELPQSLRATMARLLASYAPDLFEAVAVDVGRLSEGAVLDRTTLGDAESDLLYGPGMPYGAVFDKDLLAPVLATLGKDRAHFDVVLAGLALASNLRLTTALDQTKALHPGAPADLLTGRIDVPRISSTLMNSSSTLSWVIQQGYAGSQSDQALRKERAQALSNTLDLATNLPFIPAVSKNENVQWLLDTALEEAIGAAGKVAPSKVVESYGELDTQVPQAAVDNVMSILLQAGYLDESAFAQANAFAGADLYEPPDEDAFVDGSDPPVFDRRSAAYRQWLADSAGRSLLQNTVIDPYGSEWGNTQ